MNNVISIYNAKGGVGRSTISVLLANILFFEFNLKVAIIDANAPLHCIFKSRKREMDKIESGKSPENKLKAFNELYSNRLPYQIISTGINNIPEAILELKSQDYFDFIFVDASDRLQPQHLYKFLLEVNYILIPTSDDEFSLDTAKALHDTIYQKIKPVSKNFKDCQILFNRILGQNILESQVLPTIENKYNVFSQYISKHRLYETEYRSTLFPFSKKTKEGNKLYLFAERFIASLNEYTIA